MNRIFKTLAVLAALAPAALARADCAMPTSYRVSRDDAGSVHVCLTGTARTCPDQGLLRKDAATGEVAVVSACDAAGCFLDPCPVSGRYVYGLKVPYACERYACSTDYYAGFTVEAVAGCTSAASPPAPTADPVPWGNAATVCTYAGLGSASGCASAGPVLGVNLGAAVVGLALWAARSRRGRARAR